MYPSRKTPTLLPLLALLIDGSPITVYGSLSVGTPCQYPVWSLARTASCLLVAVSRFDFVLDRQSCGLGSPISHRTLAADKLVKIWSTFTGQIIKTFEGHTEGLSDVAWARDSTYLASASDDKTIRIWNVDSVSQPNLSWLYFVWPYLLLGANSKGSSRSYQLRLLRQLQSPIKPPGIRELWRECSGMGCC